MYGLDQPKRHELEKQKLEFAFKRNEQEEALDPDKRRLVADRRQDDDGYLDDAIRGFDGELRFLAADFPAKVVLPWRFAGAGGSTAENAAADDEDEWEPYPSAEHALQASKAAAGAAGRAQRCAIRAAHGAKEAKRLGSAALKARGPHATNAWREASAAVMEALLRDKFRRHAELRAQLAATKRRRLYHVNGYNDAFWGVVRDDADGGGAKGAAAAAGLRGYRGANELGRALERVRADVALGGDAEVRAWLGAVFALVARDDVAFGVTATRAAGERDRRGAGDDAAAAPLEERVLTAAELGRSFALVGKARECDLELEHASVSRVHAALVADARGGGRLLLVDLSSTHGTRVDGVRALPNVPVALNAAARPTAEAAAGATARPRGVQFDNEAGPRAGDIAARSVVGFGHSSRRYELWLDLEAAASRRAALYARMADADAAADADAKRLTVFVGNLSFETTEAEVRELFEPCGRIVELRVPRERGGDGGGERIRGIAFVQFSSDAGVVQALHMDRELVRGRPIKVKRSELGGNTGGGHGERRPHNGNDTGGDPKRARY